MPDAGEKLTVQEFAQRAGCTKQRVYQLLNNRLQPFTITENGRKYILSSGIDEVLKARESQGFNKGLPTLEQELNKGLQTIETEALQQQIDSLTAELAAAREDLEQAQRNADATRDQKAEAQQAAAVAAAERDAAQQRADDAAASLTEIKAELATVRKDLTEAKTAAAAARAELDAEKRCTDILKQQIAKKDEQIAKKDEQIAVEHALHAGTISKQKQLETKATSAVDQSDEKRGIFARLFRRKRRPDA